MIPYEYIDKPHFWATDDDLVLGLGHYNTFTMEYYTEDGKRSQEFPMNRVLVGSGSASAPFDLPPWYFFTITTGLFKKHEA